MLQKVRTYLHLRIHRDITLKTDICTKIRVYNIPLLYKNKNNKLPKHIGFI